MPHCAARGSSLHRTCWCFCAKAHSGSCDGRYDGSLGCKRDKFILRPPRSHSQSSQPCLYQGTGTHLKMPKPRWGCVWAVGVPREPKVYRSLSPFQNSVFSTLSHSPRQEMRHCFSAWALLSTLPVQHKLQKIDILCPLHHNWWLHGEFVANIQFVRDDWWWALCH